MGLDCFFYYYVLIEEVFNGFRFGVLGVLSFLLVDESVSGFFIFVFCDGVEIVDVEKLISL